MQVVQIIQSKYIDNNEPVSVKWYDGDSFTHAVSALASIAADAQDGDKCYTILSATITF